MSTSPIDSSSLGGIFVNTFHIDINPLADTGLSHEERRVWAYSVTLFRLKEALKR